MSFWHTPFLLCFFSERILFYGVVLMKTNGKKNALVMCECAIMIALAAVLSFVKILELPYGGSVTAFSIVPIVIISYRHGVKWGLLSGFVFSIIQLIQTASTLSYATSFLAAVTIIFLDYIFAFTVIGLAGFLRNKVSNPSAAAVTGTVGVCALRYICHVISGCTVWAGVSIPSTDGLLYSLSYNATYMIPETIINAAAVFWLFGCLNFRSEKISVAKKIEKNLAETVSASISILSLMVAVIVDAVAVFASLQNPDSGVLDFSLISNTNFTLVGIVSAIGIVLCVVFAIIAKVTSNSAKKVN